MPVTKKLWQTLKSLGYSNSTSAKSNLVLKVDGDLCFEPDKVANYFNTFYIEIATKLADKLPSPSNLYGWFSTKFKQFYEEKGIKPDSFVLQKVDSSFVLKELLSLNTSKGTGLDMIPARFLKDSAKAICTPITAIVNLSITSGIVPQDFKCARVKPLFKKNSRQEVGNYRPVAILSIMSKILERAVYVQLSEYLRANHVLDDFQSGFRKGYSTDTCLIHLTDYIKDNMAQGYYTGMVLIDVQKAFDTVDHGILCEKLRTMGVGSVDWFRSYLTERRQLTDVNGTHSKWGDISCGVPQGSILGPLLYLCYVNDIRISVTCKMLLYADDSVLLVRGKDPDEISSLLGTNLQSCNNWLIDNRLSMHLGKTECILFGPKSKLKKVENFSVESHDSKIQSVESVKYLGLDLDQSLSGTTIVNNIVKKTSSRLKFLYRQGHFLKFEIRKMLGHALVQPYFDYSVSSWYSSLTRALKRKLQTSQNKLARYILNLGPRSHIGSEELQKAGLLSTQLRVSQLRLNHSFNIFHEECPSYLQANFERTQTIHDYNTRNSSVNFLIPRTNCLGQTTFYYNAIKDWNDLPQEIKLLSGKANFKNKAKAFLYAKMDKTE